MIDMKKIVYCLLVTLCITSNTQGQGTYGNLSYFNFTYSKVADWSAFAGAATFQATVDGDMLTFGNCNSAGPTRVKGGYTGAVRCQYIELPELASLGYLSFYVQNGSSGTARNIFLKIWDEGSSSWVTAETIIVGGNVDLRISPTSVLSKKAVKVRIDSEGAYFWFHQLEAWSSTLETANVNEAPGILSINPTGGTVIPSSGSVKIQFDEIVKTGSGSISFSGSAVTPSVLGNTLQVSYSGLTSASNTLTIPSTYIVNRSNISMVKDTSIQYANDITDPVYESAAPADGSFIVVNDILEKIVLTFNEDIALNPGSISFGPATVSTSVSGKKLTISYSGLNYSTSYTLTVPANMVKDISGNTYKNDIVLNYTTFPKDNTAPTLISQSVADGAVAVPIGGSIYLTFNEIIKKAGDVTINGDPVTVSFNGSMMGINYTNLNYNTSYTIGVAAGALTDTTGNGYAGTTFQFTTQSLATKTFDLVVAADGSGDHATIQAAVNAAPDNSAQRFLIFVKNGTYTEKVLIPASKQNLSLIGQDSAKTILAYNDYAGGAGGTDNSYTINIKAPGFYAENITFKNTWAITGGSSNQAVALMTEGDRQVFKNCRAFSFQDTHYPKQANTRQYYLNCFIEGATDFMFGAATAYFESCTINCVSGGQYITAPSGTTREFGLVYNNCSITSKPNVAAQTFYLGRPWKDFGKTVWLNTKMGSHVRDIGWAVWATGGEDADNHLTGFFAEYNSMNLAGASINPTRAAWGKKLTADQASRYNIDHVFNYGAGSNSWNPLPFSTAPDAPSNLVVTGNSLTWNASNFAVGYLIFRNDEFIASTTSTSYTDLSVSGSSNSYSLKAVNEYGAQSPAVSDNVTGIKNTKNKMVVQLYPNPFGDAIALKSDQPVKGLEFYNSQGKLMKEALSDKFISTAELESGIYQVKVIMVNGDEYFVKMVKP